MVFVAGITLAILSEQSPLWPLSGQPASVGLPRPFNPLAPNASGNANEPSLVPYAVVTNSCGPYYQGECVTMRSGPGEEFATVAKLRTGIVLKITETVSANGREWYKLSPDDHLHYPERVTSDWYVAADLVEVFYDDGDHEVNPGETPTSTKRIIVDRSEQTLYAYDGDTLFMQTPISTGLELTPTPLGTFPIFKMTPSRYMQGPIPGVGAQDYYDLPGVPWNLYFTTGGAVVHGAYWHDRFGAPWSHGCVNLPLDKAKELYLWAELGTTVSVQM